MIMTILSALVAIPQIAGYVQAFVSQIILWYVQNSTNQTLSQIADAAALASKATTDEERFAAAEAWRSALNRPRISV